MGVAAELIQVLSDLQVITGLLQNLQGLNNQAVTKSDLNAFSAQVFAQLGLIQNQQLAILAQERQIWADLINRLGGLGVQVGIPQQATQPVNLPDPPPTGYGGLNASQVGDAVWLYIEPLKGVPTLTTMERLEAFAINFGENVTIATRRSPFIRVAGTWSDIGGANNLGDTPGVNPNDILSTDADLGSFLARAYPGFTWFQDLTSGDWFTHDTTTDYTVYCNWSEADFRFYKALATVGSLAPPTAPVWPGLAKATLLTPHVMVPPGEDLTIDCDGVIIDVTGTPSWTGTFSFGTAISYRNVGAVTFTSDNGQQEFAQTFSWISGVYLPKAMTRAAGYAYRAAIGVSGTITPFLLN